jgi:hypothetical protein
MTRRAVAMAETNDRFSEEDVRILDDSPVSDPPHRVGDLFDLYHEGQSVKFRAVEIVERDGRRITYGVPAELLIDR